MARIIGTWGPDELAGTALDDRIRGLGGDDSLFGLAGNDVIDGDDGNDLLVGGSGRDTIRGGLGEDRIYGGDGNDVLDGGGFGRDVIFGGAGNDRITDVYSFEGAGPGGVDELHGGDGNDRIIGTFANDPISSIWGVSYRMFGDAGNDRLTLVWGLRGEFDGGTGKDFLQLGGAGGTMIGGEGNDTLVAQELPWVYDPVDEYDKYSPGGNTLFDGGTGNDRMIAYDWGHDLFVFRPHDGRDRIENFNVDPLTADGEWPVEVDQVDLTAFGLGMTAEQVVDAFIVQRGDDALLRLAPDATIRFLDVQASDLVDSLIV